MIVKKEGMKVMAINEYNQQVKVFTLSRKLLKNAILVKQGDDSVTVAFQKTSRDEIREMLENDVVQNNVILLMTHNIKGMCYFHGQCTNVYSGNAPREINAVFTLMQKLETIQRRQDVKVKANYMNIKLSLPFRNMTDVPAELIDISAGGIMFACPSAMLMEKEIVIYHFSSTKISFDIKARILRIQDYLKKVDDTEEEIRCYGCCFEDLKPNEEYAIREFVLYLQREEILRERQKEEYLD